MLFDLGAGDRPSPIPPELSEAHSALACIVACCPHRVQNTGRFIRYHFGPQMLGANGTRHSPWFGAAVEDHQVGKVPRYPNHWYNS